MKLYYKIAHYLQQRADEGGEIMHKITRNPAVASKIGKEPSQYLPKSKWHELFDPFIKQEGYSLKEKEHEWVKLYEPQIG